MSAVTTTDRNNTHTAGQEEATRWSTAGADRCHPLPGSARAHSPGPQPTTGGQLWLLGSSGGWKGGEIFPRAVHALAEVAGLYMLWRRWLVQRMKDYSAFIESAVV